MEKRQLYEPQNGGFAPFTTGGAYKPDIDSTFTEISYPGQRLSVINSQKCGIKVWSGSRKSSLQGMAIYGDIMVCMANGTTHYIYQITSSGTLTQLATFTMNTGHSNALQFAPYKSSGQFLPYLYVSGTSGDCYVVSIASDYTASIVQTITHSGGQMIIGDDGYMWASGRNGNTGPRIFIKYRKVDVSEGDVTLTSEDELERFETTKIYSTTDVTAQGWVVKLGKIWFCYGAAGSGQKRGVDVYDFAAQRLVAELDFSSFSTLEYEDIDFYDGALLIATISSTIYMVRF